MLNKKLWFLFKSVYSQLSQFLVTKPPMEADHGLRGWLLFRSSLKNSQRFKSNSSQTQVKPTKTYRLLGRRVDMECLKGHVHVIFLQNGWYNCWICACVFRVRSKRQNRSCFVCVCVFLVKVARSKTYWNAAVLIIAIVGIVSRSLNCIHITEVTFGGVLVANDFKRFNEPLWNNQFKQLKVDKNSQRKHGQECAPCQWWSCPRPWPPFLDCRDETTSYPGDHMPYATRRTHHDWRKWRTWPSRRWWKGRNPKQCRFAIDPENENETCCKQLLFPNKSLL